MAISDHRRRWNDRLPDYDESRGLWLEATAEITQQLLGESDAADALRLIAQRTNQVAQGVVAAVLLLDGEDLVFEAVDGPGMQDYLGSRIPADHPLVHDVLREHRAAMVDSLPRTVKLGGGIPLVPEVDELGPAVVVPMPAGQHGTAGVLFVAARRDRVLIGGERSAELIAFFANQATLALDRDRAQRDRAQLAVFEDRDRIARDLHDLVIQRLFATGLQLQGMQRLVRPEGRDRLVKAVEQIDATIRDLRTAIFELREEPGTPT